LFEGLVIQAGQAALEIRQAGAEGEAAGQVGEGQRVACAVAAAGAGGAVAEYLAVAVEGDAFSGVDQFLWW
jgi:hypothetical protein